MNIVKRGLTSQTADKYKIVMDQVASLSGIEFVTKKLKCYLPYFLLTNNKTILV